jgi:glycosyltransferase involved in cell wall biosynthesis
MPLVSVGVPVYNGEKYLAATLDSLLAQRMKEFEIVISDNASTDATSEICRSFQTKDARIHYHRNDQNVGAAINHNRAFELSSAPLFHCGACDDLYEPQFLERCIEALDQDPGAVLSYPRVKMIGDHGEPLLRDRERGCYIDSYGDLVRRPEPSHIGGAGSPEMRFREVLWVLVWCLPLSGVIRRQALLKTSLFREYFGADKVLLAELALQGRFREIDVELFLKRIHRGCTIYQTTRERAEYEAKEPCGMPQIRMLQDYIKMTMAADLTIWQCLHCIVTVVGMMRRRGLWRRLLVPGPENYLGLSFGGK